MIHFFQFFFNLCSLNKCVDISLSENVTVTSCSTFDEEKYYAVYYSLPKPTYYIVRVINAKCDCEELLETHVTMKFLKENLYGKYEWPKREDSSCVDSLFIFAGPLALEGHFKFTVKNMNELKRKFDEIRQKK